MCSILFFSNITFHSLPNYHHNTSHYFIFMANDEIPSNSSVILSPGTSLSIEIFRFLFVDNSGRSIAENLKI